MNKDYKILPFRFEKYNDDEYLLTNEIGEYVFLSSDDFHKFVNHQMDALSNNASSG